MNPPRTKRKADLRAETRRAAEVTTFLLMFRNYVSAVLGKEHLPTMEAISTNVRCG